jgi:SOS-response transcriptional repressor LexA
VSENPVAQNVGGYLVSPDNKHCPIFVNYHKEEHISESIKYEDKFINSKEFDWMSKSNRTLSSNDVQSILGQNGPIRLPLFIKKNNDEGKDFYYMGEVNPVLNQVEQSTILNDSGKQLPIVKIRFNLTDPVSSSMYNYLQENILDKNLKLEKTGKFSPIKKSSSFEEVLNNLIPLYDFYAAAGTFSEIQTEKDFIMIEGPENSSGKDYFACKIIGESMNRVIPNGSICLFKPYTGGSRNGKIVLVENRDQQDPDFNSCFSIKTYSSEISVSEETWGHESIVLRPNSYDKSFQNIIITEENAAGIRVIGEFIKILEDYKK